MRKLKLWLGVLVLSTGLVFAGCSKENSEQTGKQESEVKQEDTKTAPPMVVDFKTKVYENDKFSIEVPENWVADDKTNPTALVQIYNEEMITPEFTPSIVLTNGDVIPDDISEIKKQMEKDVKSQKDFGMNIITSEVMKRSFGEIYFIQIKTDLTEEILDNWVKNKMITQEQIEQAGGKKAVIKKMASQQVQLYVKKDGFGVIIGATFDDSTYEEMKEVALYIAETLKAK